MRLFIYGFLLGTVVTGFISILIIKANNLRFIKERAAYQQLINKLSDKLRGNKTWH